MVGCDWSERLSFLKKKQWVTDSRRREELNARCLRKIENAGTMRNIPIICCPWYRPYAERAEFTVWNRLPVDEGAYLEGASKVVERQIEPRCVSRSEAPL